MSRAHVLVVPYPAQGHVNPLMDLSHELAKHDIRITFVNTNFIHKQIMKAQDKEQVMMRSDKIKLVSISDGIEQEENRKQDEILLDSIWQVMPKNLEKLIQEINDDNEEAESEKINCVIADGTVGWAIEVAEKMGIRRAAVFWPASASFLTLFLTFPKLVHDGVFDPNGGITSIQDQSVDLAPDMPAMRTRHLIWASNNDDDILKVHTIPYNFLMRCSKILESTDKVICNTSIELEAPTIAFAPKILPIGPLQARKGNLGDHSSATSFLPEDLNCLDWLDLQPDNSVIYVSFGSLVICEQTQLQELALGLELSNKSFLWVVRSDISNGENYDFLKEFEDRLSSRGKVVGWAPQKKILNHSSIACFLSHCGWNSTIEGVINGVPFLCWPFYGDQFIDENFICDIWKVGLRFDQTNGIISRKEVASKITKVFIDEGFRVRASRLKEKVINSVKEGGSSNKNLKNFCDWIKA